MPLNRYPLLCLLLAALVLPHTALAQRVTDASGSTAAGPYADVTPGAPAVRFGGGEIVLTHSESETITDLTGVGCNTSGTTTENSYFRVFDLSMAELSGPLNVTSVDIGIEETARWDADVESNVRLYTLDGNFRMANLTLIGEAIYEITDDDELTIVNAPVSAEAAANEILVVEWNVPDLQAEGSSVFFGANNAGQTGPTYMMAADCGFVEPTDLAVMGFADVAWVLNVNGTEVTVDAEGAAVAQRVTLGQAFPNPAVGRTAIPFVLDTAQRVRVAVYDALGREVVVATDRTFGAGQQSVDVRVAGLPSGLYFYRLRAGDQTLTRKMVVLQ